METKLILVLLFILLIIMIIIFCTSSKNGNFLNNKHQKELFKNDEIVELNDKISKLEKKISEKKKKVLEIIENNGKPLTSIGNNNKCTYFNNDEDKCNRTYPCNYNCEIKKCDIGYDENGKTDFAIKACEIDPKDIIDKLENKDITINQFENKINNKSNEYYSSDENDYMKVNKKINEILRNILTLIDDEKKKKDINLTIDDEEPIVKNINYILKNYFEKEGKFIYKNNDSYTEIYYSDIIKKIGAVYKLSDFDIDEIILKLKNQEITIDELNTKFNNLEREYSYQSNSKDALKLINEKLYNLFLKLSKDNNDYKSFKLDSYNNNSEDINIEFLLSKYDKDNKKFTYDSGDYNYFEYYYNLVNYLGKIFQLRSKYPSGTMMSSENDSGSSKNLKKDLTDLIEGNMYLDAYNKILNDNSNIDYEIKDILLHFLNKLINSNNRKNKLSKKLELLSQPKESSEKEEAKTPQKEASAEEPKAEAPKEDSSVAPPVAPPVGTPAASPVPLSDTDSAAELVTATNQTTNNPTTTKAPENRDISTDPTTTKAADNSTNPKPDPDCDSYLNLLDGASALGVKQNDYKDLNDVCRGADGKLQEGVKERIDGMILLDNITIKGGGFINITESFDDLSDTLNELNQIRARFIIENRKLIALQDNQDSEEYIAQWWKLTDTAYERDLIKNNYDRLKLEDNYQKQLENCLKSNKTTDWKALANIKLNIERKKLERLDIQINYHVNYYSQYKDNIDNNNKSTGNRLIKLTSNTDNIGLNKRFEKYKLLSTDFNDKLTLLKEDSSSKKSEIDAIAKQTENIKNKIFKSDVKEDDDEDDDEERVDGRDLLGLIKSFIDLYEELKISYISVLADDPITLQLDSTTSMIEINSNFNKVAKLLTINPRSLQNVINGSKSTDISLLNEINKFQLIGSDSFKITRKVKVLGEDFENEKVDTILTYIKTTFTNKDSKTVNYIIKLIQQNHTFYQEAFKRRQNIDELNSNKAEININISTYKNPNYWQTLKKNNEDDIEKPTTTTKPVTAKSEESLNTYKSNMPNMAEGSYAVFSQDYSGLSSIFFPVVKINQ